MIWSLMSGYLNALVMVSSRSVFIIPGLRSLVPTVGGQFWQSFLIFMGSVVRKLYLFKQLRAPRRADFALQGTGDNPR